MHWDGGGRPGVYRKFYGRTGPSQAELDAQARAEAEAAEARADQRWRSEFNSTLGMAFAFIGMAAAAMRSAPRSEPSQEYYATEEPRAPAPPPPPIEYKGVVKIKSPEGPSDSQKKALEQLAEMAKEPAWTVAGVANRLPDPKGADEDIAKVLEDVKRLSCGMPLDAAFHGNNFGATGRPDRTLDHAVAVGGGGSPEHCQPFVPPDVKLPRPTSTDQPKPDDPPKPDPKPTPKPKPPVEDGKKGGGSGGGKKPIPPPPPLPPEPTRFSIALGVVDGLGARAEGAKQRLADINDNLADARQSAATVKEAEKSLPDDRPSIMDQARAIEREADRRVEKLLDERKEALARLKSADRRYEGAKDRASSAVENEGSARRFFDENKDVLEEPAASSAPKEETNAGSASPASVKIWRPSSDETDFVVEAFTENGAVRLPAPDAEIHLFWEGFAEDFAADAAGRLKVEPLLVERFWPKGKSRLELSAWAGASTHTIVVTHQELEHYVDSGAKLLARQGEAALKAGDRDEAARRYWQSLNWKPSDEAADGWARSVEEAGAGFATLTAYRAALSGHLRDPARRLAIKRKAVELGRKLKPAPPVPRQAAAALGKARELFEKGDVAGALAHYEALSAMSPWWHEPYYGQALLFMHQTFNESLAYAGAAQQNYELFLEAAPKDDPRLKQAREELKKLTDMQQMMGR